MFRHVILNISNYIILYVTSHFVDLLISLLTFINQYYRYSFVVDEIQSVNICHSGPWSQLVSHLSDSEPHPQKRHDGRSQQPVAKFAIGPRTDQPKWVSFGSRPGDTWWHMVTTHGRKQQASRDENLKWFMWVWLYSSKSGIPWFSQQKLVSGCSFPIKNGIIWFDPYPCTRRNQRMISSSLESKNCSDLQFLEVGLSENGVPQKFDGL